MTILLAVLGLAVLGFAVDRAARAYIARREADPPKPEDDPGVW